jgi:Predicted phosphoglycerate mutase, AP superfamily
MKYVILHADGIADHSRQELDGRTPLQASSTPHLDRLAQGGELGLLAAAPENVRPGSGLTGTAILGYDPKKYYQGPGPLEAASLGVAIGSMMWSIVVRWSRCVRMPNPGVKAD